MYLTYFHILCTICTYGFLIIPILSATLARSQSREAETELRKLQRAIHDLFDGSSNSISKKWEEVNVAIEQEGAASEERRKEIERQLDESREAFRELKLKVC